MNPFEKRGDGVAQAVVAQDHQIEPQDVQQLQRILGGMRIHDVQTRFLLPALLVRRPPLPRPKL